MSKFNENCWKVCALSFSLCDKIFKSIQDALIFCTSQSNLDVQFEFTKLHLIASTLGACISFIQCLFSIKFVGLCSPWSLVIVEKLHVDPSCFECLGSIQSSKSQHFWISMNFDSLFFLHLVFVSNKKKLEKLHILV